MLVVEPEPGVVVLAGVLRTLDPFHAPDRHDVRAAGQKWRRLPRRRPIRVQQQPSWRDTLEMLDKPVHQVAGIRRVCDDGVGGAVTVERKRIVAAADVISVDTVQAEAFEMPHQGAVTGTRLSEGRDAAIAKVRDQGYHCGPWRRVEISLAALEVRSLAHQPALW